MEEIPIITRTYETYKAVVDIVEHLEKRYRYSLGGSLEKSILELLEDLIMTKNAPKSNKSLYLIRAISRQEVAILKLRLILELKIVNETKIFQTQKKLAEIGRMLGGWLKSLHT